MIGVIGRKRCFNNHDYIVFNKEIIDLIYENDFMPLGIILNFKNDDYKKYIDICDGIILQGGNDIYDIDKEIIKYIYQKKIPTLGICLGFQLMGESFNGKIKKINSNNHNQKKNYVHGAKIIKNSTLYNILKKENILINSRHEDNLIYTDLNISAISYDGIIEGVEDKNHPFFIGVQWHPETLNDENSKKIFKVFFDKVKEYKK